MKEIILCKYGEIVLKGANKRYFEDMLGRQLRQKAKACGNFDIYRAQSTVYIEPLDDSADIDAMMDAARKVFGIVAVCRAAMCEKDMDSILATVKAYIPPYLEGKRTFKVESKRADKLFPLDSIEISRAAGGAILESCPRMRVDVHNPDVTVKVEVRDTAAYVHPGPVKGAGGMPVGSAGRGLLLLSGGIDSPVAGYMMAKRGLKIEAIHFESFPYTSELARDKVLRLAQIVSEYNCEDMLVHVVSLTKVQEELVKHCNEDYFTLLLRRYMMAIADKVAQKFKCGALITGESLGQVASQTTEALGVTNPMATLPVFRPCIGMDKEEIVEISRKIGTFETSIEPYEDCCTVFTPRHPRTRPDLGKVMAEEQKLPFDELVEEAIAGMYRVVVRPDGYEVQQR
ncbi:MAG: tRNA 4-thiouridine(8) synthase ThiI [Ruminococcaceae bacterium]|nr:tRNA 4-thiouridine(8) synthase ThiI [Oscillospiraceae bacterium]